MRSSVKASLLTAAVLVGAGSFASHLQDQGVDQFTVSSIALVQGRSTETLMASNLQTGDICLIERGIRRVGDGVIPGGDCDLVRPGLGGARAWAERDDGQIDLSGEDGVPVMTIGQADGLAFETTAPELALVVFSRLG